MGFKWWKYLATISDLQNRNGGPNVGLAWVQGKSRIFEGDLHEVYTV